MKIAKIRILCVILTLILPLTALSACATRQQLTPVQQAAQGCKAIFGAGDKLLSDTAHCKAGENLCDWAALGLRLAGVEDDYEAYLDALRDYVSARYAEFGTLDSRRATEFHRIALTVTALGGDPTAFGTDAQGAPVDLLADGIYDCPDLSAQGLNALVFALLTLDAGDFVPPADAHNTQQTLVAAILDAQEACGGFSLAAGNPEADITAMALQALAPHRAQCEDAIERALCWLSAQMTQEGSFFAYGNQTAEASAQVIIALCALGLDPAEDVRFTSADSGKTVLDGLASFRLEDGSYAHNLGGTIGDPMATEQALLALVAVERLRADGSRLYDFVK